MSEAIVIDKRRELFVDHALIECLENARLVLHRPQASPVAWQHLNFYGRYEFRKGPQAINMEEIVQELAHVPVRQIPEG